MQREWTLISESDVFQEHIKPWLKEELEAAQEAGLNEENPGTLYWNGYVKALKMVLQRPEQELEAIAQEKARVAEAKRKEQENAGRVRAGAGFLRRLNPGWWNPGTK